MAGNVGEHRSRQPAGLRRASRQDAAAYVVVTRRRHPNRRSLSQALRQATHERSDSDESTVHLVS